MSAVASKLRKPHCFIEVTPGYEQGFLWPLENKWLPQVGPVLAATVATVLLIWLFWSVSEVLLLLFIAVLVSLFFGSVTDFLVARLPIPDYGVPADPEGFRVLVRGLADRRQAGRLVGHQSESPGDTDRGL